MSTEKNNKKQHGGWRKGAGAKPRAGGTEKICISVSKQTWQAARNRWNQKPSRLVDRLISRYVETDGRILLVGAAQ